VFAQKAVRGKVAIAQPARMAVSLSFSVIFQGVRRGILIVTLVALEDRPLPCLTIREMRVLVQVQIVQVGKTVRADVTPILQVAVGFHVIDELFDELEKMSAAGDRAAVALLPEMSAQVGPVLAVLVEALQTERTTIGVLQIYRYLAFLA
jgi:hypothetical protein